MRSSSQSNPRGGFSPADFLVVLAVLALLLAVLVPVLSRSKSKARRAVCVANLGQVGRALLLYAEENEKTLPTPANNPPTGVWWWYRSR